MVNYQKTHSQTLMPMLQDLAALLELDMASLDGVAITAGPGSFTGLRIGSGTAKGLGMALGIPLAQVGTLEALAFNLWGSSDLVCPMMDARLGQVYTALYRWNGGEAMEELLPACALPIEDWAGQLEAYGREVIFLGDGLPPHRKRLGELLSVGWREAPASHNRQRPASVAALGALKLQAGEAVGAGEHSLVYLRKSQAERQKQAGLLGDQVREAGGLYRE